MEENTNSDIDLTELEQEEINQKAQSLGVSTDSLSEHFKKLKSLATKRCEAGLSGLQLSQEEKETAKELLLSSIHEEFFERIDREGIENIDDIIKNLVLEKGEMSQDEVIIGRIIGAEASSISSENAYKDQENEYIDHIEAIIEDNKAKEKAQASRLDAHEDMNEFLGIDLDSTFEEHNFENFKEETLKKYDAFDNDTVLEGYQKIYNAEQYSRGIDYVQNNVFAIENYAIMDDPPSFDQISSFDQEKMLEELYMLWTLTFDRGPEVDEGMLGVLIEKVEMAKTIMPGKFFDDNNILNVKEFIAEYERIFEQNNPGEVFDMNKIYNRIISEFSKTKPELAYANHMDEQYEKLAYFQANLLSEKMSRYVDNRDNVYSEQELVAEMAKNIPGLMRYLCMDQLDDVLPKVGGQVEKDEQGRVIIDDRLRTIRDKAAYLLVDVYGREAKIDEEKGREGVNRFVDEYTDEKYMIIIRDKIIMDVITTGRADSDFIDKALEVCPSVVKAAIAEVLKGNGLVQENEVPFEISLENIISNESQLEQLRQAGPILMANAYRESPSTDVLDFTDIDEVLYVSGIQKRFGIEADFSTRNPEAGLDELGMTSKQREAYDFMESMLEDFNKQGKMSFEEFAEFVQAHGGMGKINGYRITKECIPHSIDEAFEERDRYSGLTRGLNRIFQANDMLDKILLVAEPSKIDTDEFIQEQIDRMAIESPQQFGDAIKLLEMKMRQMGPSSVEQTRIMGIINKSRESFASILSYGGDSENIKEMLIRFGKKNPGLITVFYDEMLSEYNAMTTYGLTVDDLRSIDEAVSVIKEGYELEQLLVQDDPNKTALDCLLHRPNQDTLDYAKERIDSSPRTQRRREMGLERIDEIILSSRLEEFINSDDRETNIEAMSKLFAKSNIEALKKAVLEALSKGRIKGDISENGFVETVLQFTGNEYGKELINTLLDRANVASSREYSEVITGTAGLIGKRIKLLNEKSVNIGQFSDPNQLIQADNTQEEQKRPQEGAQDKDNRDESR